MSTVRTIRVTLDGATRQLELPRSYAEFLLQLHTLHPASVDHPFKLSYTDPDGDIITVSTAEDYDVACDIAQQLKDFEFVARLEGERRSEAPEGKSALKFAEVEAVSTYVSNSSAPTGAKKGEEEEKKDKPLPPVVEQKKAESGEAEAEEEEPCFSCNGTKKNKKGQTCKKCGGTGKLTGALRALKKHFDKLLEQKVAQAVHAEFERQSSILSESKRLCDLVSSVSQQQQIPAGALTCSHCGEEIKPGAAVFRCALCPGGLTLCSVCEQSQVHPHALIKSRLPLPVEPKPDLKMKLRSENGISVSQVAGAKITKLWSVWNSGGSKWPQETALVRVSDGDIKARISPVGSVEVGQTAQVIADIDVPTTMGEYNCEFQLEAGKRRFGDVLKMKIVVVPPPQEKEEAAKKIVKDPVERMKRIKLQMDQLKKTGALSKSYEEKVFNLMQMCDEWEASEVLRAVINSGGDADKAAEWLMTLGH